MGDDFQGFVDSLDDTPSTGGGKDSEGSETFTEDQVSSKGADRSEESVSGNDDKAQREGVVKDAGESAPAKKAVEKTVYSAEELDEMLTSGREVDSSRLSPEGKLLMKSFQRGYDEKFKTLAEEKKRLAEVNQPDLSPKDKLFRRYLSSPTQTVSEINAEIEKLDDPNAEDYAANRRTIAQLMALKDEFRENRQTIMDAQKSKDSAYARMMSSVIEDIPDWKTKEPKLTRFAQDELGLSLEDVRVLSDPTIMGDRTFRFIKAVNKAFDKMNAGKSAESKVVKDAPKKLGRASEASSGESGKKKDPGEMSYNEYKAWRGVKT